MSVQKKKFKYMQMTFGWVYADDPDTLINMDVIFMFMECYMSSIEHTSFLKRIKVVACNL